MTTTDTLKNMLSDYVDMFSYPGAERTGNGPYHRFLELTFLKHGLQLLIKNYETPIPYNVLPGEYRKDVKERIREIMKDNGYTWLRVNYKSDIFYNERKIITMLSYVDQVTDLTISILGEPDDVQRIESILEVDYPKGTAPAVTRLTANGRGDLIENVVAIKPNKFALDPMKAYPYLDRTPAQLWEEFEASQSNVLLLIGEPGCGKSSFIRSILEARGWDKHTVLADCGNVLKNTSLIDNFRKQPRNTVVITEDSDTFISKREDGNSMMSSLLNALSGLAGTDMKLIISTNLKRLSSIDPALLRPGRTHAIIEFSKMTAEQGNELRLSCGVSPVEFDSDKVTLADALNWTEVDQNRTIDKGFGLIR